MTSLESLIRRTRENNDDAYELIVRRLQDLAVGYGYSILRDFQLAEDAARSFQSTRLRRSESISVSLSLFKPSSSAAPTSMRWMMTGRRRSAWPSNRLIGRSRII
jgi:hypothetical protein